MAQRNRSRKKQKQRQKANHSAMTREKISDVKTWLDRIRLNAERGISLSERMSPSEMSESSDNFWALAKYTENVEEAIVKLDDVNNRIYPALVELDKETWRDLKGMRSRLAHAFWNIDPEILWSTVTEYFPLLLALLSNMIVKDELVGENESLTFRLGTEHLLGLPDVTPNSVLEAGGSIVVLVFRPSGKVGVVRIGHDGTRTLVMNANFNMQLSVYGRRKPDGQSIVTDIINL